jgi:hypothetical protein
LTVTFILLKSTVWGWHFCWSGKSEALCSIPSTVKKPNQNKKCYTGARCGDPHLSSQHSWGQGRRILHLRPPSYIVRSCLKQKKVQFGLGVAQWQNACLACQALSSNSHTAKKFDAFWQMHTVMIGDTSSQPTPNFPWVQCVCSQSPLLQPLFPFFGVFFEIMSQLLVTSPILSLGKRVFF